MSETTSRTQATHHHAAVVRLAWIFGAPHDLMLFRLPLLTEIAKRRHKVLAISPDLEPGDIARLSTLGIEACVLPQRGSRLNPLAEIRSRRRLTQLLHDWRASAVIVEDADHIETSVRAAAQAGLQQIFPVLPALERGPAPKSGQTSWRTSLELASAVFVPTNNDSRLIAQSFRKSLRVAVLPPVLLDLSEVRACPLPSLGQGLIVLGAVSHHRSSGASAFVEASKGLSGRCRFKTLSIANGAPESSDSTGPTTDWDPISDSRHATLISAVQTAHVVVVDDATPAHMLLLAMALALGRPAIVTDVAIYRDYVDSGANGWLVTDGDTPALTASISAMLKRPDLLAGMARAARQKAERKLDQFNGWQALLEIADLVDLRRRAA